MLNTDIWLTEYYEDAIGHTFKIKRNLYHAVSKFQTIDIVETDYYGCMLLLDGMVMTTENDEFIYHELITHIPLLSHHAAKKVLIIGDGDGGVAREILKYPHITEITVCEIDKMVIDACKKYLPVTASGFDSSRVNVQVKDGTEYIAQFKKHFDIIIIASADPVGPGEGLFKMEFYQDVFAALTDNGIMVNQSASPWSMQDQFKNINKSLTNIFPIVKPYISVVPTYPGSFWSWTFCSKNIEPLSNINKPLAKKISESCKFYNPEIHKAVFALPNFIKDLLTG
jgi:spermidine synthase